MTQVAAVDDRDLFDPINPELQQNPYPTYRRLRDEEPVYHQPTRDFWVLSRYDDVWHALRDPARFSSEGGVTFDPNEAELVKLMPMMITTDPPLHTKLRKIVNKGFTARRVRQLEDKIRTFVVDALDRLREAGDGELSAYLSGELPQHVLAEFLGVPQADRGNFRRWNHGIVRAMSDNAVNLELGYQALMELYQYFGELIDERRATPRDDLISAMLTAEVDEETLSREDVLGFCFLMVTGGSETMTNAINNGTVLLHQHPDQRGQLAANPEAIPNAFDEIVRFEAPVQGLSRTTIEPVALHGRTIPEGTKVHLLFASANHDERVWGETADRFDVTREFVQPQLGFSNGPHYCMGAALARLQGTIVFEEMLSRMPDYELDTGNLQRVPSAFVRGWETVHMRP